MGMACLLRRALLTDYWNAVTTKERITKLMLQVINVALPWAPNSCAKSLG